MDIETVKQYLLLYRFTLNIDVKRRTVKIYSKLFHIGQTSDSVFLFDPATQKEKPLILENLLYGMNAVEIKEKINQTFHNNQNTRKFQIRLDLVTKDKICEYNCREFLVSLIQSHFYMK